MKFINFFLYFIKKNTKTLFEYLYLNFYKTKKIYKYVFVVVLLFFLYNFWISILFCFFSRIYLDLNFYDKNKICRILNFEKPKRFLFLLQNTDERKPDWGFFGSFGELEIQNKSISLKLEDSYIIDQKKIRVDLPKWFENIMWHNNIWFLWANMIWFTQIDGSNIAKIYTQTTNKKIDGIIFIKKDLFNYIMDDFEKTSTEREFLNANIDQIRWENTWNKKELFFEDIKSNIGTFWQKISIWKNIIKNMKKILENWYIRVYFLESDEELNQKLEKNKIFVWPSQDSVFFYNYNLWFNKADKFVSTKHKIFNKSWNMLLETTNQEISKTEIFKKNIWQIVIDLNYIVSIPNSHKKQIDSLAKKYNITLSEREDIILGNIVNFYNRWLIYIPTNLNIKLNWYNWDCFGVKIFETEFGYGIVYDLASKQNNTSLVCKIDVETQNK